MTPERLTEIGTELYGYQWQTALATRIGVLPRQMRRYVSGSPIPQPTAMAIEGLLIAKKINALTAEMVDG